MSRLHAMRNGRDNDQRFGSRMRGEGEFAALLEKRFAIACARLGFDAQRRSPLTTALFRRPPSPQLSLFD